MHYILVLGTDEAGDPRRIAPLLQGQVTILYMGESQRAERLAKALRARHISLDDLEREMSLTFQRLKREIEFNWNPMDHSDGNWPGVLREAFLDGAITLEQHHELCRILKVKLAEFEAALRE